MAGLIDSSVLIAVERGELDLEQKLSEVATTQLALASITASELLHGVHRAENEARRSLREAWVETLLSNFPVLGFDLQAARIHGRLSAELASKGESVGAHDFVIAATALSRGLDVITRDQRSFPRIPGLATIVW